MKRPLRDRFEKATNNVPSGPLGKVGKGDVIGALGFVAVESGEIVTIPVPGVKRPGFSFISHSVEGTDTKQIHTLRVNAVSRDVAEFAAKYESAPSNLDFIRSKTKVTGVETITERSSYSTYEIVVEVDTNAIKEEL